MDTVSNIANTATTAATKLIWGDKAADNETGGQEPVAREKGKGTIDDPYDHGNKGIAHRDPAISGGANTKQPLYIENPTVPENSSTTTDPIASNPTATSDHPAINTNKSTTSPNDDTKLADATKSLSLTNDNKHADTSEKSTPSGPAEAPKFLPLTHDNKHADTTHKSTLPSTDDNNQDDTSRKSTLPPVDDTKHTDTKMSSLPSTEDRPIPKNPNNAAEGGQVDPLANTDKTGVVGNSSTAPKGSVVNPSSSSSNPGGAPDSGNFVPKQQGADKPNDAPSGDEDNAVVATKREAEETLRKAEESMKHRDPNDHSGEPMRMHDGSESKAVPATQGSVGTARSVCLEARNMARNTALVSSG